MSIAAVPAGVLDDVDTLPVTGEIVVVLYDHHVIDDRAVHDGIAFPSSTSRPDSTW